MSNNNPEYTKTYYQLRKELCDKKTAEYKAQNKARLNEIARLARYNGNVLVNSVIEPKPYSFYRDTITNSSVNDPIWEELEGLDLTDKQRELVQLTKAGHTQAYIAEQLGVNQSGISKAWNGNVEYREEGAFVYGGIWAKLQKARGISRPKTLRKNEAAVSKEEAEKKAVLDMYMSEQKGPKLSNRIVAAVGVSYAKVRRIINEYEAKEFAKTLADKKPKL